MHRILGMSVDRKDVYGSTDTLRHAGRCLRRQLVAEVVAGPSAFLWARG